MATGRTIRGTVTAALALVVWTGTAAADIIVNDPLTITRRVTVQLIQTALNDGTSPATVFGDSTQRSDIEAGIDTIWAQAGIDVSFLPNINRYNNTFAYQGNGGSGTRPSSHFNTILTAAQSAGVLNSDSLVLNLIMVNIVPAFPPLGEGTAAGYARIDGNGMIGYVGDNLLTFDNGLDVVASVMAHEIGHNLGLDHTADNQPNLMSPSGDTEQLDSSQIDIARSSNFARSISTPIVGDYNTNGTVDAADYIIWRNTLGQMGTGLPADGNNNSRIDSGDHTVWRSNFGNPASGAGFAVSLTDVGINAVPEPNAVLILLIAILPFMTVRYRYRS